MAAAGGRKPRAPAAAQEEGLELYVLALEGGHYYVGRTSCLATRFAQHAAGTGFGSAWTKLHPLISKDPAVAVVEHQHTSDARLQEDVWVIRVAQAYGIDKVRGGAWSKPVLAKAKREMLEDRIRNAGDLCLRCGKAGHFMNACKQTVAKLAAPKKQRAAARARATPLKRKNAICQRCGSSGHTSRMCKRSEKKERA